MGPHVRDAIRRRTHLSDEGPSQEALRRLAAEEAEKLRPSTLPLDPLLLPLEPDHSRCSSPRASSMPLKRDWDPKKDAVLCNADGELTPRLLEILVEIFHRADKDKDGVLNDEEMHAYAMLCNGKPFDEQTLQDIKENLKVDKNGFLMEAGFIAMYELQTFTDPNETWKDILSNGYDLKLNRREAPPKPTTS